MCVRVCVKGAAGAGGVGGPVFFLYVLFLLGFHPDIFVHVLVHKVIFK